MSYDLHITRAGSWLDSEKNPIAEGEWLAVVRDDPEIVEVGWQETGRKDGSTKREPLLGWIAYPLRDEDELRRGNLRLDPCFYYTEDGRIVVPRADKLTTVKMVSLARRLGARVFGDEGEEYDENGDGHHEEPDFA